MWARRPRRRPLPDLQDLQSSCPGAVTPRRALPQHAQHRQARPPPHLPGHPEAEHAHAAAGPYAHWRCPSGVDTPGPPQRPAHLAIRRQGARHRRAESCVPCGSVRPPATARAAHGGQLRCATQSYCWFREPLSLSLPPCLFLSHCLSVSLTVLTACCSRRRKSRQVPAELGDGRLRGSADRPDRVRRGKAARERENVFDAARPQHERSAKGDSKRCSLAQCDAELTVR